MALLTPHTRLRLPRDSDGMFEPIVLDHVLLFHLLDAETASAIIAEAEVHAARCQPWMEHEAPRPLPDDGYRGRTGELPLARRGRTPSRPWHRVLQYPHE
jgi:hypothetical protein